MGRRRGVGRKPAGPKRVSYKLIDPDSVEGKKPYAFLAEIIEAHHEEISEARIALAWNLSWKPDEDGRVKLGHCRKATDLDRELAAFDFVVMLRQDFWQMPTVNDDQRRALLDHQLCHATIKLDKFGEKVEDERGRKVYRIVKHDIEEFSAIVDRHGVYTRDLENFAAALRRGAKQQTLPLEDPAVGGQDKAPTKPQVQSALANVAAAAGEAPPTEPQPGEPHAFVATGDHGTARTMCKVCGAGKTDPIHGEAAAAPSTGNGKGEHPPKKARPRQESHTSARKAARAS